MLVCGVAQAGVIGHGVVAVAHRASSYQNNNQISVHPVTVVAHVAHAPVAVAHAPIAVAHAPVAIGISHHGLHGLH